MNDALRALASHIAERLKPGGVLMDVKSVIAPGSVPSNCHLWSL